MLLRELAEIIGRDNINRIFGDKRKSNRPSNIAGRQLKFWVRRNMNTSALEPVIQDTCANYDCRATFHRNYIMIKRRA